ncbi:MAG: hypothetical protein C0597_05805 [Marinilabiliales bacterium]|nr:MAG: hypothetical protein C0597_05805 [Marinilabiliales bacterium]
MIYFVVNKHSKNLFLFVFIVCTFISRAQDDGLETNLDSLILPSQNYSFHDCSKSKVTLFNMPVNSILDVEIKTDFEKLFQTKKSEQSRIEGLLSYTYKGKKVRLPIKIKARGNTRFTFCKYKPLDIKFSSSTDSTLFKGLGEKIEITTHCGDMEGQQWVLKGSETEHVNRLLAEYYINSMLEMLGTVTSSVSLCKLKYISNEDSVLTEQFAFIVEPDEIVAERCELIKTKEQVQYLSESALMTVKLINSFIANYDWHYEYSDSSGWIGHNIKFLKSENDLGYILPYDFDMNAIAYPDYWKNSSESFDEHCNLFEEMLSEYFSDKKKLQAPYKILVNIPAMRNMIKKSYMNADYKQRFIYWLDSYEFILLNHLSKYRKYRKKLL